MCTVESMDELHMLGLIKEELGLMKQVCGRPDVCFIFYSYVFVFLGFSCIIYLCKTLICFLLIWYNRVSVNVQKKELHVGY
jgi:hypothetical protein